jgi:hypothetical protein
MEFGNLFDSSRPSLFWEGVVVSTKEWPVDETGISIRTEVKNWGRRVKVRINGVHPDKKILPDSKLPWLEVPASSLGSGHGGAGASTALTQGTRVLGMWYNVAERSEPFIILIKQNNEQTNLQVIESSINAFNPTSGYNSTDVASQYNIPYNGSVGLLARPLEGITYPNLFTSFDKQKMGELSGSLPRPSDCESVPLSGLQKDIIEAIQDIEKAQKQLKDWSNAAQGWIAEKQAYINKKIKQVTEKISGAVKWVFEKLKKAIYERINKQLNKLLFFLNPSDRDKAKSAKDTIIELITCIFNKLIGNLFNMILGFVKNMINKYINVPECIIENLIATIIGNLAGSITGIIDGLLSGLSSIVGGVISIASGILDLVKQLLGFFTCDSQQKCPDTNEWNILSGGKPGSSFDLNSIFNQAKGIVSDVKGLTDVDQFIPDYSKLFSAQGLLGALQDGLSACYPGPVFCGPPTVKFWGGGGSGAKGNAIVGTLGEILGVDITASGSGYTKEPFVTIDDNCGKGQGAVLKSEIGVFGSPTNTGGTGTTGTGTITGDGGTGTFGVTNVIVVESGYGYISKPDGDLGGDGRIWATKDQTIVQRENGTYDLPYNPGEEIIPELGPNDKIYTPEDRNVNIIGKDIIGNGLDQKFPTSSVGTYPVILYLCGIRIINGGINYSPDDEVIIENNTGGAVLKAEFGPFGVVTNITIVESGNGFTETPEIYIKSATGYNAQIVAVLCVNRVGEDISGNVPLGTKVIDVVDCVGKF